MTVFVENSVISCGNHCDWKWVGCLQGCLRATIFANLLELVNDLTENTIRLSQPVELRRLLSHPKDHMFRNFVGQQKWRACKSASCDWG